MDSEKKRLQGKTLYQTIMFTTELHRTDMKLQAYHYRKTLGKADEQRKYH